MTLLSPPFALGASGQLLSGKLLRLSLGATWRPTAAALGAVSGVVHGPAGSMMELALVNPTTVGVNPGFAVIQGTLASDQGQYEVPNDAYTTLALTAQHASQFRRALIVIEVNDSQASGVASSGTTDRARLYPLDGPLSASNPAPLPAVPANTLVLGEVSIPPVGQTVTLTPYNPRTTGRGGIQPVFADTSTVPGHGAEPGAYFGQYRRHPTRGLEWWDGAAWRRESGGQVLRPVTIANGQAPGVNNAVNMLVQSAAATFYGDRAVNLTAFMNFYTPNPVANSNLTCWFERFDAGGTVLQDQFASHMEKMVNDQTPMRMETTVQVPAGSWRFRIAGTQSAATTCYTLAGNLPAPFPGNIEIQAQLNIKDEGPWPEA